MKTFIAAMILELLSCAELQADLAFNPKGDLFVLGRRDEIFKYTADGTKSTFAILAEEPVSLAFDKAGNLFVGDSAARSSDSVRTEGRPHSLPDSRKQVTWLATPRVIFLWPMMLNR